MRASAALLLLLSAGCLVPGVMGGAESEWYDVGPVRRPLDEVVQVSRNTVARLGYRLLPVEEEPPRIVTDWDVHLSPHWREGFRTKVEIQFEEHPSGGGVTVRIRSIREINDQGSQPTIAERAQWVSASIDDKQKPKIPEMALKVRQLLKFKFETKS